MPHSLLGLANSPRPMATSLPSVSLDRLLPFLLCLLPVCPSAISISFFSESMVILWATQKTTNNHISKRLVFSAYAFVSKNKLKPFTDLKLYFWLAIIQPIEHLKPAFFSWFCLGTRLHRESLTVSVGIELLP